MYIARTLIEAPTAAPPATPSTSNDHIVAFDDDVRNIYVHIEDASDYTVALDSVELELYGYINDSSHPVNIYIGTISNSTGRCMIPIPDQTPDYKYLYLRQAGTLGVSGGTNAPIKYEIGFSKQ